MQKFKIQRKFKEIELRHSRKKLIKSKLLENKKLIQKATSKILNSTTSAFQVCGLSTWRWPSCCRRASASQRGAWWTGSRAQWTTWWTCCISSWWSPRRSRSTLASLSSFLYYSSPRGTPCTSCMRTKPRENAASAHKEQTRPTHPTLISADSTLHLWNECLPPVSSANLLQSSSPTLAIHFSATQQVPVPNSAFLPARPCATAANKNSGEIEWETPSPFM